MVSSIYRFATNKTLPKNYQVIDIGYLMIEEKNELYPDLKINNDSKIMTYEDKENYIKVLYLNSKNNLKNFKVLECNNVKNCTKDLVINLNYNNQLNIGKNYLLRAKISEDKKINFESIVEI
ncbi:MAG: hypothetical protein ACRCXZ_07895 [Patescibacteria group bacterium]